VKASVLTAGNESLINDWLVDGSPDTCVLCSITVKTESVCVWTVRISVSHTDTVAKYLTSKADYES